MQYVNCSVDINSGNLIVNEYMLLNYHRKDKENIIVISIYDDYLMAASHSGR